MTLMQSLALLAAVVLIVMAGHAWWSSRQARGRRGEPSPRPADRVEPGLSDAPPARPALPAEARAGIVRRAGRLDALIDAIAPLALDAQVSGAALLAHMPVTRRAGTKVFLVEGLNAEHGQWESPLQSQSYSELQAGVQLASRSGALNEIEYSEFVQKVQDYCDAVGAMPDFPDMLDVVARARELDAFASPLDAVLTVTLQAGEVIWSVQYLQQCATRIGFVPGALPGRWVLPAAEEGAPPVLVLSFDSQAALADEPQAAVVRECVLSLDVPQTAEALEPFPAWHNAARKLADELAARLVDDRGQPVTLHAFSAIGRELDGIYRALASRDLPAGSAAARRLFS